MAIDNFQLWLRHPEIAELDAELSKLEAEIDARGPAERTIDAQRIKELLLDIGDMFKPEDEEVLKLYCEGVLDTRHLQDYFGERLLRALQPGERE